MKIENNTLKAWFIAGDLPVSIENVAYRLKSGFCPQTKEHLSMPAGGHTP